MRAMKAVKLNKSSSRNKDSMKVLRSTRALPALNKVNKIPSEIDHIFDEVERKAHARMIKQKNLKERRFSLAEIGPIG